MQPVLVSRQVLPINKLFKTRHQELLCLHPTHKIAATSSQIQSPNQKGPTRLRKIIKSQRLLSGVLQ